MPAYNAVITGLAPLLMNRFQEEKEVAEATRKIHVKTEDPRKAAERTAYRNENGELYLPGAAIARMLREAGGGHKQRGSRKSLKFLVPGCVLVLEEVIVLRDSEGNALTHFEIDSRPVVIPATKGRIMRHRPRINAWHAEFTLEIDTDMMEDSLIHQLLVEAGTKLGLLDYRPEKGGSFGRFSVTSWQVYAQPVPLRAAA